MARELPDNLAPPPAPSMASPPAAPAAPAAIDQEVMDWIANDMSKRRDVDLAAVAAGCDLAAMAAGSDLSAVAAGSNLAAVAAGSLGCCVAAAIGGNKRRAMDAAGGVVSKAMKMPLGSPSGDGVPLVFSHRSGQLSVDEGLRAFRAGERTIQGLRAREWTLRCKHSTKEILVLTDKTNGNDYEPRSDAVPLYNLPARDVLKQVCPPL